MEGSLYGLGILILMAAWTLLQSLRSLGPFTRRGTHRILKGSEKGIRVVRGASFMRTESRDEPSPNPE